MSLTNPNKVITEERLSEFYQQILPYMGGMPEMVANKFSRSDIYSTTEKIVGQWINGKPLYQKTVSGLNLSPGRYENGFSLLGISNIDIYFMLLDKCIMKEVNGTIPLTIPFLSGGGSSVFIFIQNNKLILVFEHYDNSAKLDTVTIQYTKTTDSATSIGVDTDYSTTEKIIGTWIDGKPLYQKTFTGTITAKGDNVIVNDNKLNLIGIANSYITKGGWTPVLPYLYGTGTALHYAIGFVQDDNKRIVLNYTDMSTGDYYIGATYYITLQYTKTTD